MCSSSVLFEEESDFLEYIPTCIVSSGESSHIPLGRTKMTTDGDMNKHLSHDGENNKAVTPLRHEP